MFKNCMISTIYTKLQNFINFIEKKIQKRNQKINKKKVEIKLSVCWQTASLTIVKKSWWTFLVAKGFHRIISAFFSYNLS